MVVDPYNNPAVKKRMLELQQTKYRQGHRNAVDANGNPAYVLTGDERISCLDPGMQQVVRQDMRRIKVLDDYAKPFVLTIGIGELPPNYIVNVTHPQWGHARRQDVASQVDNLSNPESWFKKQIDSMKQELGYEDVPATLSERIDKYLKPQEEKRQVADVNKMRHLICPDHGNEMVRGTEPGTLVCTVVGCKRVARKKPRSTAAAIKEPKKEEPAVEESPVASDLAKTFEDMDKYFGPSVADALNAGFPPHINGLTPNNNTPRLQSQGGRYYLVQEIGNGRIVYVDITVTGPDIKVTRASAGFTDIEIRMSGVQAS